MGATVLVAAAAGGCSSSSGSTESITPTVSAGTSTAASGSSSGAGGAAAGTASSGTAASDTGRRTSTTSGSAGFGGTTTPPKPGPAQGPVRGYYAALGAHDPSAARQYLSPEYLASFSSESAFAAWVANYRSLTGLTLLPARAPGGDAAKQHPGYRDLTLLPISYTARLRTPSANEVNGQLDRFVLVGRSATSGRWLILDIATSP